MFPLRIYGLKLPVKRRFEPCDAYGNIDSFENFEITIAETLCYLLFFFFALFRLRVRDLT